MLAELAAGELQRRRATGITKLRNSSTSPSASWSARYRTRFPSGENRESRGEGGFVLPLPQGTGFGRTLELLGDLDRDGNPEIATGGVYFDDDRGTVWILSLRTSAVRKGNGVNTVALSQKADPVIGHTWRAVLDCRGLTPGVALLGIHEAPQAGLLTSAGEWLVAGPPLVRLQQAHAGTLTTFDLPVPRLASLVHRTFHAQGLCTGAAGAQLSNALDVLVGR